LLAKNKGRTKGIIVQSRNHTENIIAKALAQNPEAMDILNRHTIPKDVLKMAETDFELRQEIDKRGLDRSRIETVPKTTEITNPLYLGKKQTRKQESPFTPQNHKISIIQLGYFDDED
jgi:hypothetical protein